MGYRSDVRIIMSRNGYQKFQKYVDEHINDFIKNNNKLKEYNYDYNLLHNLDVSKQSIDDNNKICIGWDSIKWYDGYEEVDSIMDSLDKLEKNGFGYSYARIGDNLEDYEERFVISTSRDNINYLEVSPVSRSFDDYNYIDIDLNKKNKDMER